MFRIMSQLIKRIFALIYFVLVIVALALIVLSYVTMKLIGPAQIFIGVGLISLFWFVWAFVFNRRIEVGADEAKIVRRWMGSLEALFHGEHRTPFGYRVIAAHSLSVRRHVGNEESLTSGDGNPLRLRSDLHYHIADPVRFHLRGKKCERRLAALVRGALAEEIGRFSLNDLWNCPAETNRVIKDNLRRKLYDCGLEVSDFRLEEVILPRKAVKWRRNTLQSASMQAYWVEFALA
ncbi:MAG: hypothetical protein JMDDDDMK_04983 [Acidobacteria bacterium]|nr:hypothetical protein [Acidobacteriota bacterium]